MMTELETVKLRDVTIVRPKGQLGTIGWHPKAWTAAVVLEGESPKDAFLSFNALWNASELH